MFRSNTGRLLAVTCLLNITAFIGCETMTGDNADNAGNSKIADASPGVVDVSPTSAAPGERVRVTADGPVFGEDSKTFVQIGAATAVIVKTISDTQVDVLVPDISPGIAPVAIFPSENAPGPQGQLNVLEPISQQLLLSLNDGVLRLISAMPRGGEFHNVAQQDEPRISYDLYNVLGKLIFTSAIVDPTRGRFEIYDKNDDEMETHIIRRATPPSSAVFPLMIPNLPGGALVQFYQADAGVDLNTPKGREMRRFLSEILLGDHPENQ